MDFDVVAYLASKGLRGRPASGGRELVYACFFDCAEPADSRKKKLYVNVAEGVYHCKVCLAQGGTWMLQKHFGDEPRAGSSDDAFLRRRILDEATTVGQDFLRQNDDALLYLLNDRGLSTETIEARRLGFVAGSWSLVNSLTIEATPEQLKSSGLVYRDGPRAGRDFFVRHLLIPYISRGHTISMRARAWGEVSGGKYLSGPGEPVRLYNADALEDAEEAIITEGEFDAMILEQTLRASGHPRAVALAVVALPGTSAIPEELDDVLAHCKRIYLGLDPDDPGQRAAAQLKERIGNRARNVLLPYEDGRKCDWTEYLLPEGAPSKHPYAGHDWRDVLRLLSSAGGRRVFSMAEAGDSWRTYRETHSGLKTGFKNLDYAINPGLLPGQVLIALAKTGTGKTLWLCNLAYNMRQHKVLIVSLEMTREEIYERMRRIYLFHHPRATDQEVEFELRNVYVCDENRLGEKDLSVLVAEFVIETDARPEVVMVDYLGYYARGQKGSSPYEKVSNAVMNLKAEAKANRFVVIAPSQVNRVAKEGKPIDLDDARDSGAVEETADFLLALYRPDDALNPDGTPQAPTGKVKLAVLKSRHGGKGNIFGAQMDLLTLAIVDDNTPAARRADEHNRLFAWRGMDYDDLRRIETAPEQQSMDV